MKLDQIKAFLFDMDGVLYDSMKNHATAWTAAVSAFGLSMTREEVYMNEGRTGAGTINELAQRAWGRNATEEEIEAIYKKKSDVFNTCPKTEEMEGAAEVLDKVKSRGLARLIVTGSGQKTLLERLNKSYPGHFTPEMMVTAFDVTQGKPWPEPYLKGLKKAGENIVRQGVAGYPDLLDETGSLLPEHAIVVENAPLGIHAAQAAGIFCIAVPPGPLPDKVLEEAGADMVLPSMKALAGIL